MIERTTSELLERAQAELGLDWLAPLDDNSELSCLDPHCDASFSLEKPDSSENVFACSGGKVTKGGQKQRNPFQNLTNCRAEETILHKDLFFNFSKKPSQSLQKLCLKENRVSMETRVSEAESICDFTVQMQEEKSSNLQLAEQLQDKARLLNQKITEKLSQIKQQFWKKRAHSLLSKPAPAAADPPKLSLLAHLRKKASECDPPEALKNIYMKFIPMRSVLSGSERVVTNRKVAQSRLADRISLQFKCGV